MTLSKFIASIIGSTIAAGVYLVPNTIWLEECRKYFALYKYRVETPVHKNVLQRLKDVMKDLGLTEDEKDKIKPFSSFGYDTWHLGSTKWSYGAILGIGANLEYIDIPRINLEGISVLGEPMDWSRNDAQMFLGSCKLSDEAQKYLLARDVLKIKSKNLEHEAILVHSSVLLVCCANILQSHYFPSKKYTRSATGLLRIASLFIGYFIWGLFYDAYDRKINNTNDEEISKLGTKYVVGGKEYYEKCLARNLSFLTLLPMGYLYIKENGEPRTLLRWKSPVLRDRIQFFSSKFEESEKQMTV